MAASKCVSAGIPRQSYVSQPVLLYLLRGISMPTVWGTDKNVLSSDQCILPSLQKRSAVQIVCALSNRAILCYYVAALAATTAQAWALAILRISLSSRIILFTAS